MNKTRFLLRVLLLLSSWTTGTAYALTAESGDFTDLIAGLKALAFGNGSGLYVIPTAMQLSDFTTLATSLASGDTVLADSQAAALNYELVEYTDTISGRVLHGVREQLTVGQQTLGWGSFFIDLNYTQDVLVQAPHPVFDTNSWIIAAQAFQQSTARGFLIAGAHRNANGSGTADVAHLSDSVFQRVHEAWNGVSGEITAWQVHGFNDANHSFPTGTDAVLSVGDGTVSSDLLTLDAAIQSEEFLSYAYNTLDPLDVINVQVNEAENGSTFSTLGATTNKQGIYSRGLGGSFLHIELEQSIRLNGADNRGLAATAIAASLPAATVPSTPPVAAAPLNITFAFAILFGVLGIVPHIRRKSRDQ